MNIRLYHFVLRFSAVIVLLGTSIFWTTGKVTPVIANSNDQAAIRSCANLTQTNSQADGPVAPMIVPPGSLSEDANWPIVSQEKYTHRDGSRQDVVTTIVIRRDPSPKTSTGTSVNPLTATCTLLTSESQQIGDQVGGLTQYLTTYYRLYNLTDSGDTYKAYHTYRTEVYWTRTGNSYSLGQPAVKWFFRGPDCNNVFNQDTNTGAPFSPNWYYGNKTSTYYWTFMDTSWPTRSPVGGSMYTSVITKGYYNGFLLTPSLSTVIYYTQ